MHFTRIPGLGAGQAKTRADFDAPLVLIDDRTAQLTERTQEAT